MSHNGSCWDENLQLWLGFDFCPLEYLLEKWDLNAMNISLLFVSLIDLQAKWKH